MYGVGRSTAREAYRMMQAIDMIDVKRGKGAYFKGVPSERTDDSCVACWFKEHGQRLTSIMEVAHGHRDDDHAGLPSSRSATGSSNSCG